MGFGSYDESEQERQSVQTDFDADDSVIDERNEHEGSMEFDNGASNEELVARLEEIKEE